MTTTSLALYTYANDSNHCVFLIAADVMLLTDVFETFREVSMEQDRFQVDPAHYVSAPQMAWDAMLNKTNVKLDLVSDPAMFRMFEGGMRGGVCMISKRFSQANNKYMGEHYDPTKPSKYIIDPDANNLYGWAMSQFLPTGDFKWVPAEEFNRIDWTKLEPTDPVGYAVQCDLEYPPELHALHNEYPMAPERLDITVEMLSDTQVQLSRHYARTRTRTNVKLVPNLMNKVKYTTHYLNLKFFLGHGMKLTKVHKVISFAQSRWMEPYISMNTSMRAKANNEMEKNFHKLMNNAVYGKTCENQRKRSDIRLVTDMHEAEKLVSKPHCVDVRRFSDTLLGIEMKKVKLVMSKPSYIGFCVLELSKLHMMRYTPDLETNHSYDSCIELLHVTATSYICFTCLHMCLPVV